MGGVCRTSSGERWPALAEREGRWEMARFTLHFPALSPFTARQAKRRRARRQSRPRGAARKKLFAQFGIFPCRPGGTAPRRRRVRCAASMGCVCRTRSGERWPIPAGWEGEWEMARFTLRFPFVRFEKFSSLSPPPSAYGPPQGKGGHKQPTARRAPARIPNPLSSVPIPLSASVQNETGEGRLPSRAGRPSSGTHIQRRSL